MVNLKEQAGQVADTSRMRSILVPNPNPNPTLTLTLTLTQP